MLLTLTETLIILDIRKTESHTNIVLLNFEVMKWKSCFCFFTNSKQFKAHKLDVITHRNHAL